MTVSFEVSNSGTRAGAEVAQVYVSFPDEAGEPPLQLKGFEKVRHTHHTTHSSRRLRTAVDVSLATPDHDTRPVAGCLLTAVCRSFMCRCPWPWVASRR